MNDTERLRVLRGILTMITEDVVTQTKQMTRLGWKPDEAFEETAAWWRSNLESAIEQAWSTVR